MANGTSSVSDQKKFGKDLLRAPARYPDICKKVELTFSSSVFEHSLDSKIKVHVNPTKRQRISPQSGSRQVRGIRVINNKRENRKVRSEMEKVLNRPNVNLLRTLSSPQDARGELLGTAACGTVQC